MAGIQSSDDLLNEEESQIESMAGIQSSDDLINEEESQIESMAGIQSSDDLINEEESQIESQVSLFGFGNISGNFDAPFDTASERDSWGSDELEWEITYSAPRTLSIFRLIESHPRRVDSTERFPRFLMNSFDPDYLELSAEIVREEISRRMKWWSYVPFFRFSEEDGEHSVLRKDLYDSNIIFEGLTERPLGVPLYFGILFTIASKDLLAFSDFVESVDYSLVPTANRFHRRFLHDSSVLRERLRNNEDEELHSKFENFNSLISYYDECRSILDEDFQYMYQAKRRVGDLSFQFSDPSRNFTLCLEALTKLCLLRDFLNYSTVLYIDTALETMDTIVSCLSEARTLFSSLEQ